MTVMNVEILLRYCLQLAEDLNKLYLDKNQFYATFLHNDGTPLVNTTVKFNINGVFYNRVTDNNGVAKLNIKLFPGKYILTAYNPLDGCRFRCYSC